MGYQRATQTKTTEANSQRKAPIVTQPPLSSYSPVHPILQLQQKVGNQAVNQLTQTKLKVGQPGDAYEREADQVAATVMRMPAPQVQGQTQDDEEVQTQPLTPLLQRQSEQEEEDEKVQMLQRQAEEEEVQTKANPGQTPAIPPDLEAKIRSRQGTGQPLPKSTRAFGDRVATVQKVTLREIN